jgi:uncharacterized protein (DUF1499 family)
MTPRRRMGWIVLTVIVGLPLLLLAAGQAGLLAGRPPQGLGVHDGRLKAPRGTPNNVHSQAMAFGPAYAHARIEPLPWLDGDGEATITRLRALVEATPGARVVEARADYLRVEYTTRRLRFVDDAEFWADPAARVVQVRSASRLGHGDHGVNRGRIEALRRQLTGP